MKGALKQTTVVIVPPHLDERVRTAMSPRWLGFLGRAEATGRRSAIAAALVLVLVAITLGAATRPSMHRGAANTMDRLALRLDDSSPVVLEGTVLCRDCELERRYGIKSSCKQIGHHGAIFTADGRILNIVEQRSSASLIHDETMFGKRVVVRGRLFRGARALVIDSYQPES